MKKYNVGILGATGAVGREMTKILIERNFPLNELRLFASSASAGEKIDFNGEKLTLRLAEDGCFDGLDMVLGAADNTIAKRFAPSIVKSGAVFIDNSSAFRLNADVPLVVSEINPEDVARHHGIIANPNCTTIISLVALNALNRESRIESIVASSYQAVSGAGAQGISELSNQAAAIGRGEAVECKVFPYQIAYNVIPQIGGDETLGYTSEEMKLQNEGRKILHNDALKVSCTCVRVPVFRSHSVSLLIRTEKKLTVQRARELIASAEGCVLCDDIAHGIYPMPLDTSDQDKVFVGRIRPDLTSDNGLALWCCGDQLRKGAATNAVQIAELVARL